MNEEQWLQIIGTGGPLGVLVFYLIVKRLPAVEKRHQEERENERQIFLEYLDKRDQQVERITEKFTGIAEQFHDELIAIHRRLDQLGVDDSEPVRGQSQRGST